uniref:NADH dehydrogenase subunit 2 n=1 Tax=Fushitsunagia catenata TaxID=1827018 RepID=UPI0026E4577C|nr:NADH dehydrogenase subunit 2 [Fushitsunagia catenata]WJJ67930.1 NADH dehydrogenase subunit 2 [Fushitsunagia catenata]
MITSWFNLYSLSAEIYLILSVTLLLVYGVLLSNAPNLGFPILTQNIGWLTLQVLMLAISLLYSQPFIFLFSWNNFLVTDLLAWNLKLVILVASFLWVTFTLSYVTWEKLNSFEFWILSLLAISAMLLVTQAFDLLSIYLAIEFQSLSFYILASFKRNSEFSTEAGLKYFILGAFSSALFLFGSSILYGFTGLTNLHDFTQLFYNLNNESNLFILSILFGFSFILAALFFKISSAPFHMWSPDVYEGSPTSVTALFSILPKIAIIALLLRFLLFSFQEFSFFWKNLVFVCGASSLLIGSFSAFLQTKWKRFLAFSSITHVGFILVAVTAGGVESISNTIFYLIIYVITMIGIFSFLITLRFFNYPNYYQSRYLLDLTNLGKTNSTLSLALLLLLFSMTGIPPLAGFFAKFFILLTSLQSNSIGLAIFVVVISSISCFYYIKIIKNMYFVNISDWAFNYPITKVASFTLGISILFTLCVLFDLENLRYFVTAISLN